MPRRSARIRDKVEEQKELETELPTNDESLESKALNSKTKPKGKSKAKAKGRAKGKAKSKSTKKEKSANEKAKETVDDSASNEKQNTATDPSRSPESPTDVDDDMNIPDKEEKEQSSVSQSLEPSEEVSKPLKRLSLIPSELADIRGEDAPQDANAMDVDEEQDKPSVAEPEHQDAAPKDQEEEEEDEAMDEEPAAPMVRTRARRKVQTISYKDESSSEEDDDDDEDADNPMFAGLSKAERKAMKAKMNAMQSDYSDTVRKEREQKLREIIDSFDLNIGATVTMEEAAFILDFCRKQQQDVITKIEEEGDFFLECMREMMEEKMRLLEREMEDGGKAKRGKRGRRRGGDDDSESEFDMNDFSDGSDSEYSMDSDWEHPDEDNENMISDEDEYGGFVVGDRNSRRRGGGRRRRNKNVWRDESGREYYAKGRLLLNDALKDTENFEGWSAARVGAWKNKDANPNAYYYRFNDPGEEQINGAIAESEHKGFMQRVMEMGVNQHWGIFSQTIKGRVGYQCSNYWRQMMKDGWVKDPNYWIRSDGSFQFKRAKKGSIPDAVRKYSFVVLKDPSKTFDPLPGYHPKRPSDKTLEKFLEKDVRELDAKEKKGGKKAKKSSKKKAEEETNDNQEKQADDSTTTTDNKQVEEEEMDEKTKKKKKGKKEKKEKKSSSSKKGKKDKDKKTKKKDKKKKKKKKEGEDGEEIVGEDGKDEEGKKSKKKKKSKKDKKSKSKKKDKKKKSKKDKESTEQTAAAGDGEEDGDKKDDESSDSSVSGKRGRKRKHAGEQLPEFEPPSKKRKTAKKPNETSSNEENEEDEAAKVEQADGEDQKNDDPLSIIRNMTDIMTGQKMQQPTISPFGYVMDYNSWCSILRNARTKNKCPFTKKPMTRRQLVKLDADNIEQYKDKIVNITAEDMENFNS